MNHVSAMHIAAAQGNIEIGMMLADRDAKLDVKDKVWSSKIYIYFVRIIFSVKLIIYEFFKLEI